ncbi:MAG: hypothetical protein AABZ46_01075, partial [Nitrospirota bacterium]
MTAITRILDFNTIVASIGLIMATMSFITGIKTVKQDRGAAVMMVKMHKLDGYVTCQIYIAVALLSLSNGGFRLWPVIGWVAGLALIIVKIIAVRNKKYIKYASRLGIMLFLAWLFIIYQH